MTKAVVWNNVSMLTPGMKNLGNQINSWAPNRDGTSDGAVGNYAHTLEHSGHNPDDTSHHNAEWDGDKDNKPEIRAIDVDIDFKNGFTAQQLVDHIVGLKPSSVLRYVIYNKQIWEATNNWKKKAYTGDSEHTEHIHFSGAYSDTSDENKTFNFKLDQLGAEMNEADFKRIQTMIDNSTKQNAFGDALGGTGSPVGSGVLNNGIPDSMNKGTKRVSAWVVFAETLDAVKNLQKTVDELSAKVDSLKA